MSNVTNAILHYGMHGPEFLAKVNAFFDNEFDRFVSVEDEHLPPHWYGGTKSLECDLAIGAFNVLDLDGLIKHLCSLSSLYDEQLRLIVKEQEDERFRIINIANEIARNSPT
jgi:hypothetical protein